MLERVQAERHSMGPEHGGASRATASRLSHYGRATAAASCGTQLTTRTWRPFESFARTRVATAVDCWRLLARLRSLAYPALVADWVGVWGC